LILLEHGQGYHLGPPRDLPSGASVPAMVASSEHNFPVLHRLQHRRLAGPTGPLQTADLGSFQCLPSFNGGSTAEGNEWQTTASSGQVSLVLTEHLTCVFGHQPYMRRRAREAVGCVSSEPDSAQIAVQPHDTGLSTQVDPL